ncbi:MAG: zinc ribbon domain-containing protein [Brachybacterium sp.]|nr:zinc ribbon domain-containing protein [Brachybacterium sp.]
MPTYVYACKNCGHQFEQHQSFSDDALTRCPACEQESLRKVFNSVGIVFKGSGFYRTDSQSTTGSAKTGDAGKAAESGKSSESTSSSSSSSSSESTATASSSGSSSSTSAGTSGTGGTSAASA